MKYTTTTFIDKSAPYVGPTYMNALETQVKTITLLAREAAVYNSTGSTSANYNITVDDTTPTSDELPLVMIIIPGVTNAAGLTVTPSWGATAYQVYDRSTNAQVAAGVIKQNQPVELIYDGTVFWVNGDGRFLKYALIGSNVDGFFDVSSTNPTGTNRLNYSGKFYATELHAPIVWGAVFNPTAADVAEGYPVLGDPLDISILSYSRTK